MSYSFTELACAACASISSRCLSHRARDTCVNEPLPLSEGGIEAGTAHGWSSIITTACAELVLKQVVMWCAVRVQRAVGFSYSLYENLAIMKMFEKMVRL